MRRRALLCAAATVLAGCGGSADEPNETTTTDETTTETTTATDTTTATTTQPPAEGSLELGDHELVRLNEGSADELARVVGTVRNAGDAALADVTVSATFVDGDGATLDTASADVAELAAGAEWSFQLTYSGVGEAAREVADYSLTAETGD